MCILVHDLSDDLSVYYSAYFNSVSDADRFITADEAEFKTSNRQRLDKSFDGSDLFLNFAIGGARSAVIYDDWKKESGVYRAIRTRGYLTRLDDFPP